MLISTEIHSASSIVGEEKAVELCAKAGFDAWDFSMFRMIKYDWENKCLLPHDHPLWNGDYLAMARKLKRIGEDNGIFCNQSHAPFPIIAKGIMPYLYRAIECTAEAGGKICIVHPDNHKSAEQNAEIYNELLIFAKQYGVTIAAENMWSYDFTANKVIPAACSDPASFNAHLDAVNDENLVACLDIGHAEMNGLGTSAVEMIHALGKRLKALHIHDNDLINDSHMIPFSMKIDFSAVVRALRDIGYDGIFTLEANQYLKNFDKDSVTDGMRDLMKSAKRLADMFEKGEYNG